MTSFLSFNTGKHLLLFNSMSLVESPNKSREMLNISVSLLNKRAEHTDTMPCRTVPLTSVHDGYPPPFDLAQLRVRHLNLEGQSRDPHVELQLSAQVSVGEVHHHPHFALHLLAIHENVVTPV